MRSFLIFLLVLLFAWTPEVSATADLKRDMVQFDRAFIPVWYHVWQGDAVGAKKKVFYLAFEWQKFENRYGRHMPESDDWQESLRRVGDWLDGAFLAIDGNCLDLAYNQLDHVRYEMMDLRSRMGMDYYLDHLFDFEMAMATVLEVTRDPDLASLEWDGFRILTQELTTSWETVAGKDVEAKFYQLDPVKQRRLTAVKELVADRIKNLESAVDNADQCEVLEAMTPLESAYIEVLLIFGNFSWEARAGL